MPSSESVNDETVATSAQAQEAGRDATSARVAVGRAIRADERRVSNDAPEREAEIRARVRVEREPWPFDTFAPAMDRDLVLSDIGYLLDALDREREALRELREAMGAEIGHATETMTWNNAHLSSFSAAERNTELTTIRMRLQALLHPEDASEGGKA